MTIKTFLAFSAVTSTVLVHTKHLATDPASIPPDIGEAVVFPVHQHSIEIDIYNFYGTRNYNYKIESHFITQCEIVTLKNLA